MARRRGHTDEQILDALRLVSTWVSSLQVGLPAEVGTLRARLCRLSLKGLYLGHVFRQAPGPMDVGVWAQQIDGVIRAASFAPSRPLFISGLHPSSRGCQQ
jgi:hypothetical protein